MGQRTFFEVAVHFWMKCWKMCAWVGFRLMIKGRVEELGLLIFDRNPFEVHLCGALFCGMIMGIDKGAAAMEEKRRKGSM